MARLWRITAPHFVAGLETNRGGVVHAAPILWWAVGRAFRQVRRYMEVKGWKVESLR